MDQSTTTREWLGWLTRVRLLTILLILVVDVLWPQYVLPAGINRSFLPLLLVWVTLGVLHIGLIRWLPGARWQGALQDRKSTRLNSSHGYISYAVFCLKKKKKR